MAASASPVSNPYPSIGGQPYIHRYVPVMKTKAGEITALENLSGSARDRILPLFHVTENLKPSFLSGLTAIWAGRLAAIDGAFNFEGSGSTAEFVAAVAALRAGGVFVVPCWSTADPAIYQQTAASLVNAQGAMVKTKLNGIGAVSGHLTQLGISASAVDLVIDLGHLAMTEAQSFGSYVAYEIGKQGAALALYRSVTLIGAAAPKDYGSLAYGANIVPRKDWQIWQIVRGSVPVRIDYGDFMTAHPDLTEPPGAAMAKATVSVRYTRDNDFLLVKGYATTGPNGRPMAEQYRAHAGTILANPCSAGVSAWADAQIIQAAAGAPKLGSRSKWSAFAANRHISLVIDRLP